MWEQQSLTRSHGIAALYQLEDRSVLCRATLYGYSGSGQSGAYHCIAKTHLRRKSP
jgi:hypothetical protein